MFSFSDFQRLFGGLASNREDSNAVQQFSQNGGAQAYVLRVPMHNDATLAVPTLSAVQASVSIAQRRTGLYSPQQRSVGH